MRIARRIRKLRLQGGRTLQDIALESGLDRHLLSRLEAGEEVPSLVTLEKLAAAFRVSVSELVYGYGDPPVTPRLTPRLSVQELADATASDVSKISPSPGLKPKVLINRIKSTLSLWKDE